MKKKTYKKYRNRLKLIIKTAKKQYYKEKLFNNSGNPKITWKIINDLINKTKSSKLPNYFHDHEK